jgi:hypothetical protein
MRIWNLVQDFNSKDFEVQTKDNLDSNKGFGIDEIWIRLGIWIWRKAWIFSKNRNYMGDFEVLSERENQLGWGIKFESTDLIQIKGYLNSRQGFDLKDFPI